MISFDSYEFYDFKKPLEDFDSGFLSEFRCSFVLELYWRVFVRVKPECVANGETRDYPVYFKIWGIGTK